MKKCIFLIPTYYNDGRKVAAETINQILHELFLEFGGYSQDGFTEGTWRMRDGTKARDRSLKYGL